jgi:putative transposase
MSRHTTVIPFRHAEAIVLGKDALSLSPAVVARLTAEWQAVCDAWQKRELSARRYLYVLADGVNGRERLSRVERRQGHMIDS